MDRVQKRRVRRSRGVRRVSAVTLLVSTLILAASCGNSAPAPLPDAPGRDTAAAPSTGPLPQVTPQPQRITRIGDDVAVRGTVVVAVDQGTDRATTDLVTRVLRDAGANKVDVRPVGQPAEAELTIRVGSLSAPDVADGIAAAGPHDNLGPEGYALAVDAKRKGVTLGGVDQAGTYYAAQTLRQLASAGKIAGAGVIDRPSMPLRGAIEGFYGSPWTHAERMDQLAFYGQFKLNTYVYAPKDDPYHREQWRDPYPPAKLSQLAELVRQAQAHHVKFTFALSPGVSMCYSDQRDFEALKAKLQAVYDIGVRDFSIPFDDITYGQWNCAADQQRYGSASKRAAGQAQADILNRVQKEFVDSHAGVAPLQTVPTEYSDMQDSQYKSAIRERLNKRIRMMWTGNGVIPERVSIADARAAAEVWGRKVFLWDNYPVNDFDATAGRLLLGPYAKREQGLHHHLTGVVVNPMNQAGASKVAEIGAADFSWNDSAYNEQRAWRAAANYLSRNDATAQALLAFFDLEHAAPLPSAGFWQPQAPELKRRLDAFRSTWNGGDKSRAVRELRTYAQLIADSPERIRSNAATDFAADAAPWLDATNLWGDSLMATLDGLQARVDGNETVARQRLDTAADLARRAGEIRTVPGETRPQGPVRVADGVLDVFINQAPNLR